MIQSRGDLYEFLLEDARVNHFKRGRGNLFNSIYWFLVSLRYVEYYRNCAPKSPLKWFYLIRLNRLSVRTGLTIPPNTFGKGLYVPHYGCIVINGSARFGDNCVLQCGVNVSEGVKGGNDIYLGAGSKVLTNVRLGDGIIVGANSVVTKSFESPNMVLAGIPAKVISDKGRYSDRQFI